MEDRLAEISNSFAFKLGAAKYHQKKIQDVFLDNKVLISMGERNSSNTRPFMYHYYALVYELFSCFDMTLLYIKEKFEMRTNIRKVRWNNGQETEFSRELREISASTHEYIDTVTSTEWFKAIKETRNHLAHHGIIGLQIETNETQVTIINPIINSEVFHFDLNLWGEEMSNLFSSVSD